jgi:hypothetical protein
VTPSPSASASGHPDYTPTAGPPSGEPGSHGFAGSATYVAGSGVDLVYVIEEPFAELLQVKIDDVPLTAGIEYTARAGSTVVTLKAAHLDSLAAGEHRVRVEFTDAIVEDVFTVKASATESPSQSPTPKPAPSTSSSTLPGTGAEVSWTAVLWSFAALGIGVAMMVAAGVIRRRPEARRGL